LAETDGFEPSVDFYTYGGLANRWFKPLTHVSIIKRYSQTYDCQVQPLNLEGY
jgi:hypothetical protein